MRVVATIATYPKRASIIEGAIASLAPQVDVLHLVCNEFTQVPEFALSFSNVEAYIPSKDMKDVGKFLPKYKPDDLVFLADDDLKYSSKYVEKTIRRAEKIGLEGNVFGYHARTYRNAKFSKLSRRHYHYRLPNFRAQVVDELGSGTLFALGKNIAPIDYMDGAQRFADIRYAKWAYENDLNQIVLAHGFNIIVPLKHKNETIYNTFTKNLPNEAMLEISIYAGKNPYLRRLPY